MPTPTFHHEPSGRAETDGEPLSTPPGDQGAGDRAPGDHGAGDRAPGDHGAGDRAPPAAGFPAGQEPAAISRRVAAALQAIIALGLLAELYEGHWLHCVLITGILLLTALPSLVARRIRLFIPPEFELLTIGFIFASLYLGERRDYYERFWWWDLALHTTAGGLLGILGFLLVFVLNQNPRVDMHMRPGFVAFFAFCFSVAGGAVWEIYEFAMDQCFGMQMQKPMFDDPSGLTDTMWDLIVDCLGALAIATYGYLYLRRGQPSLLKRWIRRFIAGNPHLFPRAAAIAERERKSSTDSTTDLALASPSDQRPRSGGAASATDRTDGSNHNTPDAASDRGA